MASSLICLSHLRIPKVWRRAIIVAIQKPSISLLCVPGKILEKLIQARVEPINDPLFPAGLRRRRSTVDQALLLTQNIEDCFEAKTKTGAVQKERSDIGL